MGTDFRGGRVSVRPFRFRCGSRAGHPPAVREPPYRLTDRLDHFGAKRDPQRDLLAVAIEPNLHLEGVKELTL